MTARGDAIRALRRDRPRSRFVRWSVVGLVTVGAWSWGSVLVSSAGFLSARRIENVRRFLGEIRPFPLRDREFDLGEWLGWAWAYVRDRGGEAMGTTVAISVAAIALAGTLGLATSFLAARTFFTPEPYAPGPRPASRLTRALWRATRGLTRAWFVLVRALPEYLLAFLLLAILGPSPWTAVLALAMHNLGILGRLTAETIENLPPGAPSALRGLGAGRLQLAATGIVPAIMPRFLLYFFYRWETCVREATVLGMLGIVSLGYWIVDARARTHYDELMLLVLLGATIVIAGDVISAVARAVVRRAA